jgi:hypothetical protein
MQIDNARQDRAAEAQTAARSQAYRNAFEWKKRAIRAQREGDLELGARLNAQVKLEIGKYQ